MLNELYTFAEPVQVVPFSNLKWGKFTLLHTLQRRNTSRFMLTLRFIVQSIITMYSTQQLQSNNKTEL